MVKILKKKEKKKREILKNKCKCGELKSINAKVCKECSTKDQRNFKRPPYETLLNEIKELGYSGTGRKYGVSDNAIRKWKKYYEK